MRWNQTILSYDMDRQMEVVNAVGRHSMAWSNRFDFLRRQWTVDFSWVRFKGRSFRRERGVFKFSGAIGFFLILSAGFLAWGALRTRIGESGKAGEITAGSTAS